MGILAVLPSALTIPSVSTSSTRSTLLRGLATIAAASLLLSAPAHAHDGDEPDDEPAEELTDEQTNALIFGVCEKRPPAFAAPLALRVLPATPEEAEVTALRVEGANLPIVALEIPYPDWETAVTATGVEARYVGDLPQETPPYRFWFWLGLDKPEVTGGEFSATVVATFSDGHTVSHILDDPAGAKINKGNSQLPKLRIPYTPNMVASSAGRTELDGVLVKVEPCVMGREDLLSADPASDDGTSSAIPLPLLAGGAFFLLILGAGGGFVLGRRR